MQSAVNEFIPQWEPGEAYGEYCDRLEEAVVAITALEVPTEVAIEALAFIAMEAPADFGYSYTTDSSPFVRIQQFLSKQPENLRMLFRVEAEKLPRGREDRISMLLTTS